MCIVGVNIFFLTDKFILLCRKRRKWYRKHSYMEGKEAIQCPLWETYRVDQKCNITCCKSKINSVVKKCQILSNFKKQFQQGSFENRYAKAVCSNHPLKPWNEHRSHSLPYLILHFRQILVGLSKKVGTDLTIHLVFHQNNLYFTVYKLNVSVH